MARDLKAFWDISWIWSQHTFGLIEERGPMGPLDHLTEEVEETKAIVMNQTTPEARLKSLEEHADMMHLVFDSARRAGFGYDELVEACWIKLGRNIQRHWGEKTVDKAVKHIDDSCTCGSFPSPKVRPGPQNIGPVCPVHGYGL